MKTFPILGILIIFVIRHSAFVIVTAPVNPPEGGNSREEQNWPQWRGPTRDGVVTAAATPDWPQSWRRAWRVDVGEGYSSPVVADGRVFVHSRRDPDEVVTAIDLASGTPLWQQKYATRFNKNQYATSMSKGPHATPVVMSSNGGDVLVTVGGTAVVTGWNARTGEQRWRKDYSATVDTSKLFTGTAPLWTGRHLVASGTRQGTRAFTLTRAGGTWAASEVWKNPDVAMYMSTPVLADGVLYGLSARKKGQIVAVDAATGAVKWMTDGRAADQAAILLTASHVLVQTTGDELILVERSSGSYKEVRRYPVADSATWAVPAFVPGGLIVRDATGLMKLVP